MVKLLNNVLSLVRKKEIEESIDLGDLQKELQEAAAITDEIRKWNQKVHQFETRLKNGANINEKQLQALIAELLEAEFDIEAKDEVLKKVAKKISNSANHFSTSAKRFRIRLSRVQDLLGQEINEKPTKPSRWNIFKRRKKSEERQRRARVRMGGVS